MKANLTLRMDKALIDGAKRYAAKSGQSVSKLVADYFALLETYEKVDDQEMTPWMKRLYGSAAGAKVDEEDYRRHLEEKYGPIK